MHATPRAKTELRVLAAASFGHLMTHLYMLVFPALVTPLRAELGLDLGEAMALAVLGYLLYGLGALPAGLIADRWSARGMLCVCLAASGSGAMLAGWSRTPTQLALSLGLVGLGASIYHPTGMALIARTFSERRGRAMGVNGVFGNIGLAGAPVLTGLLTAAFGWRSAYLIVGVPGLLGALAIALMPFDESSAVDNSPEQSSQAAPPKKRYFALLCLAMVLAGLTYRATSVVMPSYFELKATFLAPFADLTVALLRGEGATTTAATMLTSLVYLVGIIGQIIGGRVADRSDLRVSYVLFHLAALPALIAMVVLSEVPLLFAAMGYILFSLGMQPIENSLVAKLAPAGWRSTAYGVKFILTFGVGSLAVALLGYVRDPSTLPQVFAVVAVVQLLQVLVAVVLWRTSRHALPQVRN